MKGDFDWDRYASVISCYCLLQPIRSDEENTPHDTTTHEYHETSAASQGNMRQSKCSLLCCIIKKLSTRSCSDNVLCRPSLKIASHWFSFIVFYVIAVSKQKCSYTCYYFLHSFFLSLHPYARSGYKHFGSTKVIRSHFNANQHYTMFTWL